MAARFARIYTLQQQGQFFTTPEDLLAALGLFEFTQTSAADYMKVNGHACCIASLHHIP
jgi:hypothetical protein